jgi:cyclopropane fatty-acyl-phospholipid synthase-like methyltransferase
MRYGKPIDSTRLKINVDKRQSIEAARAASTAIPPGKRIARCPVCFGASFTPLCTIYGFEYAQCNTCETAVVVNPPAGHHLEEIYSSEYYTTANRKLYANDDVLRYRLENIAGPKVDFVLDSLDRRPRSWLDIGCGTGEILKVAADRGLRVAGAETNAMQREFAKQRFGLDILPEYVNETNIRKLGDDFDVISLFSVLEHVPDPDALLRELAVMQPSGTHLVVEVPHYPSLSSASQQTFPGLVNRMMHPPLHLFLFSLKGLQGLLARHGYDVTHCWLFGQDVYEFATTLSLVSPEMGDSPVQSRLFDLLGDFQRVVDERGFSDEMLVVASKR